MGKSKLQIFIAGSKVLVEQRRIFRSVLMELQTLFNHMIEAKTFEDFSDSLIQGGRQTDYNNYIANEADIVAFIFDSNVGGITREEFDVAYHSFENNKRPNIYVYCRNVESKTNQDIETLKEHLNSLGQYYTEYTNNENLQNLFKNSINKFLIDNNFLIDKGKNNILKIKTDLDCKVFVDGDYYGVANVSDIMRIPLRDGSYQLHFEDLEMSNCFTDVNMFHIDRGMERLYLVTMRTQKESMEKRKKYILNLPDERFKLEYKKEERKCLFLDKETKDVLIPNVETDGTEDNLADFLIRENFIFREGLCPIQRDGELFFIDKMGNDVLSHLPYSIFTRGFQSGTAIVRSNANFKRLGVIDKTGIEIIPCSYDLIYRKERSFIVEKQQKYGLWDEKGNEILPCAYEYDQIITRNGVAVVKTTAKTTIINILTGREIFDCDEVEYIGDDILIVKERNKYGVISKNGNVIISCIYDYANPFFEGVATVKKDDIWYIINKGGKQMYTMNYIWVKPFVEGLAIVKRLVKGEGKYGFINRYGKEIIPCIYDDVKDFINGLAKVKKYGLFYNEKVGYIDKTGKWVKNAKGEDSIWI